MMGTAGVVAELWRYPVKSMQGETCERFEVGMRGIVGDRAFALVDVETAKIASAKNPRVWPGLLAYGARYLDGPVTNGHRSRVEIAFPGGAAWSSDDASLDAALSTALGRSVTFSGSPPARPQLEEYWPDLEDLAHRDEVTQEAMPSQTFFDCATVHVLTTNTLRALQERYDGDFDVRRFRPNVLVDAGSDSAFAEDAWIGKSLHIGDQVVLNISGPAGRCVMTTLPQNGLAADNGILRTAAQCHAANVGVYAEVVRGGRISNGDEVRLAS